jgi:hypothetical protein
MSVVMTISHFVRGPRGLLLGVALFAATSATGCQTWLGGQTLPSAYYLKDDVQYFRTGPEFKLTNTVRALDEYKLQQQRLELGLQEAPPGPPGLNP